MNDNTELQNQEQEEAIETGVAEETAEDEKEYFDDGEYSDSRVRKVAGIVLTVVLFLAFFGAVFTLGAEAIAAAEYPKVLFNPAAFSKTEQAQKVMKALSQALQ